jgi:hypothetical protein
LHAKSLRHVRKYAQPRLPTGHAMIEIKCPRCEGYWYSDDEDAGSVRLCPKCADQLRSKRGAPRSFDAPFFIWAALFLAVDVVLIVLTAVWPGAFGYPVLAYGLILCCVGLRVFRLFGGDGHIGDVEWTGARWPVLAALAGLACVLAAFSFAILPK